MNTKTNSNKIKLQKHKARGLFRKPIRVPLGEAAVVAAKYLCLFALPMMSMVSPQSFRGPLHPFCAYRVVSAAYKEAR